MSYSALQCKALLPLARPLLAPGWTSGLGLRLLDVLVGWFGLVGWYKKGGSFLECSKGIKGKEKKRGSGGLNFRNISLFDFVCLLACLLEKKTSDEILMQSNMYKEL